MITSTLRNGATAHGRTMGKARAALAAVAAAAVLAAGGGVALASTGAAAMNVPRCRAGGLVAGLYGRQQDYAGTKGHGGFILTLTNKGARPCYLYGYPGLGLEDASHQVIASHTHRGPTYFAKDQGKHRIRLSPGETASADVAFVYTGKNQAGATYLEVTPPGGYNHAVIEIPEGVGLISTNDVYVTAMARHTPWKTGRICC